MLEHLIEAVLPELIRLLELTGTVVILIGSGKSFLIFLRSILWPGEYRIKAELGRALELGLEYKMGAEILKTVLVRDMGEIWILGSIILLRGVLSILLHFEMKEETSVSAGRPL